MQSLKVYNPQFPENSILIKNLPKSVREKFESVHLLVHNHGRADRTTVHTDPVPRTRSVLVSGDYLSGGGSLDSNRTININAEAIREDNSLESKVEVRNSDPGANEDGRMWLRSDLI